MNAKTPPIKYPPYYAKQNAQIEAAAEEWRSTAVQGAKHYVADIARACGLPTDRRSVQYLGTTLDKLNCTRWRNERGRGFIIN